MIKKMLCTDQWFKYNLKLIKPLHFKTPIIPVGSEIAKGDSRI
jgi:hypothetical protein